MADSARRACLPLPIDVVKRASTSAARDHYIVNFLKELLPSSDAKSVTEELSKTVTFNKYRTKHAQKRRRSAKFLTSRKRTLLGLHSVETSNTLKYSELLPMNDLWLGYMQQMLAVEGFNALPKSPMDVNWDSVGQQLLKADFHGAMVSVCQSKCPSMVGVKGIIVQDTKGTFRLLGEDDVVRTIPKETTGFEVYMKTTTLRVFGRELCTRPAERSVKKFKTAHIADL